MSNFVLYYQSTGRSSGDGAPLVLCVGTKEKCEWARDLLKSNTQFAAFMARDRGWALQIVAAGRFPHPVVSRIRPYHSQVASLGGVHPV